jgi:SAM-dependent methyltransferase
MTQPSPTTPPADLEAVKRKQQATWASGDYSAIGALIPIISEDLCDAADLRAGSHVLDVAGGSGNTALAAARMFCDVVSLDYVPSLLERGRERAAAEQLPVCFVEGDAEALPFEDASFDAVISVVGVMFAPDHERAAAELVRVCRPRGTIALASWTPEGFIGGLLKTVGKHVPPPAGVRPPTLWGDEDHVRGLLGAQVDVVRRDDRLGDGDDTAVAITAEYLQAVGRRAG